MHALLTDKMAADFARIALSHVAREYPAKMDHVITGPSDIQGPRALHPAFHGSFDWHSCVHGFWLLATLIRHFPDLPQRAEIRTLFDTHLTAERIAGELRYLSRPMQTHFERPYGWAWLLALAAELARHGSADAWSKHLRPLSQAIAQRFEEYLSKLPYPIRTGTHPNTAFAAALAIEYAQECADFELLNIARARVREFFERDVDIQAWEPGGNEFLSPALMEVECMRRALPPSDFVRWLERFLPRLGQREPRALFDPVAVPDRRDPQIVHLDGLNLSRAWCWRSLADALPAGDPRRKLAAEAADAHLSRSLPHLTDDYVGEHWLATFALLALMA